MMMVTSGRGCIYLDIGRQRMAVLDMAGAERYMEKALACFREDGHDEGVVQCLLEMSDVYLYTGRFDKAEACSKAALERATEKGLRHYLPLCYNTLGMAKLISASNKSQGISYLLKSLDMLGQVKTSSNRAKNTKRQE